ncbi:IucA/IucC family protein [Streptomyces sp. NPDC005811]|uniref:IucA/IucC family protein n=1 Tax=Streptomyces sp. NPDC005811 TaxID=3154565 RepID=UPI0033F54396
MDHPDPHTAAQAAAVESLLRCWVREAGLRAPADGTLRVPLPASGTALLTPVHYWSPTGWHHFGLPRLADTPEQFPPVDAVLLAALLSRETPMTPKAPATPEPLVTPEAPVTSARAVTPEAPVTSARAVTPEAPVTSARAVTPEAPVTSARAVTPEAPLTSARAVTTEAPELLGPADAATPPGLAQTPDLAAMPDLAGTHALAGTQALPDPARTPASPRPPVGPGIDQVALVARVADSVRRTTDFIRERREHPADGPDLFLSAEQALLLGHPLHPTPKSREGLSDAEGRLYSPEVRGSFPLHWLAVAPSLLAADSAWTESGRTVPADRLTARLADAGLPLPVRRTLPDGYALLPMHPWQLHEVGHRPDVAALFTTGLLRDLGPLGIPWCPTSSVRTVYRSGAPAMLKLSLGLHLTNSRRENLRKELRRGVEVHRLLRAGLSRRWQAAHPGFDIVRDPAWLAVDGTDGRPVPGLDVVIRHNPFTATDDVSCVAGLVSPRPPFPRAVEAPTAATDTKPVQSSRLADVVTRLAARTGRPLAAVAVEWFLRYLEHIVRPVLWLDGEAGIALEAHQQNTLLLLDPDGWPTGGRYRDNQGYYFRDSRRAELEARLPGIGEHSDTFVSDAVTDERFAYYLGINNVLGLVGAFGSQRLAGEHLLLAAFRRFLTTAACGPDRSRSSLPARLLDSPVLRCKANLLTRLHGMDELVGPVDTQSVYVTIANPLHS